MPDLTVGPHFGKTYPRKGHLRILLLTLCHPSTTPIKLFPALDCPFSVFPKSMDIHLFYRKSRHIGNFSIETSFDTLLESFPANSPFRLKKIVSSYFSNGFIPRLWAIVEARRLSGPLNHITGDVHFLALGLPGDRTILTIHDCGFMHLYQGWRRELLRWFWLALPVWHCRYITAVSEATKAEIIRYTGCAPEKIRVIPTIISRQYSEAPPPSPKERPLILHIGTAANKNLERHAQALRGLPVQLYVVGKLTEIQKQALLDNQIDYQNGYNLSLEALQGLYASCDLLLFASTLEGFGMPILEAQAVGRPVVTSNISSMPYVAGAAACLVDPFDAASIRAGVEKVLGDENYRRELVEKGRSNVLRFSAEAVAKQYEDLYAEVARG
jgi:glycosyltransferase involved in cell wall biosynthesis